MDRPPLIRRIVIAVASFAVIGGAVAVLHSPDQQEAVTDQPPPPPQTTVERFAAPTVSLPEAGPRPSAPAALSVRPGPHRLVVGWGSRFTNAKEPDGAAGYEVRWGAGGRLDHTRLLAEPITQLSGLVNGTGYQIEVRAIGSFGQRSDPAKATGTPSADATDPAFTLVDRFDGTSPPDPNLWRLTSTSGCARATEGDGTDTRRLLISGQCGAEPTELRSRTPFRLTANPPGGELGRVVVDSDQPGQTGQLMIDLVPGPADLLGGSQAPVPAQGQPGRAQSTPTLPPGAIRVLITGQATASGVPTVQVLVGEGTPLTGQPVAVSAPPRLDLGVTVRWQVVLRTDGLRVQAGDTVVGGADVVPAWSEATALIGTTTPSASLRSAFDLIAFSGGSATPPPALVVPPDVEFGRGVSGPDTAVQTPDNGPRIDGVTGGQLRLTVLPQNGLNNAPPSGTYLVEVGGKALPAQPAVSGQRLLTGVLYPIVAQVPPELLVLGRGGALPVRVRSSVAPGVVPNQVVSAEIELTPSGSPPVAPDREPQTPAPRDPTSMAVPTVAFLDAGGKPIARDATVPRGRLVLAVSTDGLAGQRVAGELAGMAGIELRLDGELIAGLPTTADGPGVGGDWRFAVDTSKLTAGRHVVEVRAVGVDATTVLPVTNTPFAMAA